MGIRKSDSINTTAPDSAFGAPGRRSPAKGRFHTMPKVWIAAGIGLILLLSLGWPLHVLALRDARTGHRIFTHPVSPGDTVTLCYNHSVKHKPVWDFYVVGDRYEIVQSMTIFPDSDYGLPSLAVGSETYTRLADGNGCISGMHRLIPSLLLRVEGAYDNTLTFNNTLTLNLAQKFGDCVVDMRIKNTSPLLYLFQAMNLYGE